MFRHSGSRFVKRNCRNLEAEVPQICTLPSRSTYAGARAAPLCSTGDERMLEVPLGFSQRLHQRPEDNMPGSRRSFQPISVAPRQVSDRGAQYAVRTDPGPMLECAIMSGDSVMLGAPRHCGQLL